MILILLAIFILTFPFTFHQTFFKIIVPGVFKNLLYPLASFSGSKSFAEWVHLKEGLWSLKAMTVWIWQQMYLRWKPIRLLILVPDFAVYYFLFSVINGKNPVQAQREKDAEQEKKNAQKDRKKAWDQAQGEK